MSNAKARQFKLDRIREGHAPRVLDLFSGCGGLSLGFDAAGFSVLGGVEVDSLAARTHAMNFHPGDRHFDAHEKARDITATAPVALMGEFGVEVPERAVDVIVGGPPCQAFARVGRAKLREVAEHPTAFLHDPRAGLYVQYLRYVEELQPLALVMENVPDILNFGGQNVAEEVAHALGALGYRVSYTLLNSVNYGVPQMRERMFLIALADEVAVDPQFPEPSHWIEMPRGYASSRQVALRSVLASDDHDHFLPTPMPDPSLAPAVTAKDALADLPPVTEHLRGELKRGARRFDTLARYRRIAQPSPYATAMREWPGFESGEGVYDHVIRSLPRDYAIFAVMNPGDQYPEAHEHAKALFEKRRAEIEATGTSVRDGSRRYVEMWNSIVPPYDPGKFPNKWRKMEADRPARTLMAHLGKDGYSHIHYDSRQARTISVREAARLQSFPDGFVFAGTMNPAFRQIGNAVPPLLARAVAERVHDSIQKGAACLDKSRSSASLALT